MPWHIGLTWGRSCPLSLRLLNIFTISVFSILWAISMRRPFISSSFAIITCWFANTLSSLPRTASSLALICSLGSSSKREPNIFKPVVMAEVMAILVPALADAPSSFHSSGLSRSVTVTFFSTGLPSSSTSSTFTVAEPLQSMLALASGPSADMAS